MENDEALDRIVEQSHGITMEKLFWIAVSTESYELSEFLNELEEDDLLELFPKAAEYMHGYMDDENLMQMLFDNDYYGFLAVVHVPIHRDFTFNEDGTVSTCSSNRGNCYIDRIYAETTDELVSMMEAKAQAAYDRDTDKARKAQGITSPVN